MWLRHEGLFRINRVFAHLIKQTNGCKKLHVLKNNYDLHVHFMFKYLFWDPHIYEDMYFGINIRILFVLIITIITTIMDIRFQARCILILQLLDIRCWHHFVQENVTTFIYWFLSFFPCINDDWERQMLEQIPKGLESWVGVLGMFLREHISKSSFWL